MKTLLSIFLVSCCFTCFGCSRVRGQGKLDGDVFIVTEGAQNVKLGLVEVQVLPYEETRNSIATTKARADREVANLQPQLDAARKALASAEAREKAADAELNAAANRTIAATDLASLETLRQAGDAAVNRWDAATNAVIHANEVVNEQEKSVRRWNSGALYFASLPPPTASVKTDADGKFSILVDRTATVVLAAYASRRLPNKTENYYWIVTVSLNGQPSKRIFLSNDNLATSDSKDSLVHVVE
jgi:hypothetical protein